MSNNDRIKRQSQNFLFVIASLYFLFVILLLLDKSAKIETIFALILMLVFLSLAFCAQKRTLFSLIFGLTIYLTLSILDMVLIENSISIRGLILRGVIIIYFIYLILEYNATKFRR